MTSYTISKSLMEKKRNSLYQKYMKKSYYKDSNEFDVDTHNEMQWELAHWIVQKRKEKAGDYKTGDTVAFVKEVTENKEKKVKLYFGKIKTFGSSPVTIVGINTKKTYKIPKKYILAKVVKN